MFSEIRMVKDIVDQAISANKVMMFSKTFCPFCTKAKDALKSVGASFEVMELENRSG
jgi:glutaredoxin 3